MKPLLILLALAGIVSGQSAGQYRIDKKNAGAGYSAQLVTPAANSIWTWDGSLNPSSILLSTVARTNSANVFTGNQSVTGTVSATAGVFDAFSIVDGTMTFATDLYSYEGTAAASHRAALIPDGSLSIAKVANLQTTLDGKAALAGENTWTDGNNFNSSVQFANNSDYPITATFTYDAAAAASHRTALGLVPGTNVQAYDADLTTWAGITPSASVQAALPNATNGTGGLVTWGSSPTFDQLNAAGFSTTKNADAIVLTTRVLSGTAGFQEAANNHLTLYASGNAQATIVNNTVFAVQNGMRIGWAASGKNMLRDASSTLHDTAFSKVSAGVVALGNGAAGNTSGTLQLTNLTASGTIDLTEQASEPAAPAANGGRLFLIDDGSGKTVLKIKFATGAAQTLATQP